MPNPIQNDIQRPAKRPQRWKRILKWTFTLGFICAFLGALVFVSGYFYLKWTLPKLTKLTDYQPSLVTEIYSKDFDKIAEYSYERRFLVSYDEIPEVMIQAFIASEDSHFFEHEGIDYKGIMRASIKNVKAGRVVQGGSTITQQVAKSLLLTNERSFRRKFKEAFLALRIEKNLSKKEILYLYLNQIYLGHAAYGVQAAARNYFQKDVRDLNLAESALLAGLPQAPSRYSPFRSAKSAKERQVYVLRRMFEEGYITNFDLVAAKEEGIKLYRRRDLSVRQAPDYAEYARRYVEEKYGKDMLYSGGLKVFTAMDLAKQQQAKESVQWGLKSLDKRQGYRGVIGHIDLKDKEAVKNFHEENHKEAAFLPYFILPGYKLMKEGQTNVDDPVEKTPLEWGKNYKALITEFDPKGKFMVIQIGTETCHVHLQDLKWARTPNPDITFDENQYYVKRPNQKFKLGDIVSVSMKRPKSEELKSKKYQKDINYFYLEQTPKVQGALLSMDPRTGFVMAMIGGYDFQSNQFNRAVQGLRQPGSAFKPIIYAAALDKGYTQSSIFVDSPIVYETELEEEEDFRWRPKNYGGKFYGDTPFRKGLVKSMNIITIKILQDIGVNYATAFARKLGIQSAINRDLSMALGSSDVSLLEITNAYSVFARLGKKSEPIFITKILDRNGHVLERRTDQGYDLSQTETVAWLKERIKKSHERVPPLSGENPSSDGINNIEEVSDGQAPFYLSEREKEVLYKEIPENHVISPQTAYLMTHLLTHVVQNGTGQRVRALGRPAAGKTGTTNDEYDAWFIGFTPDIVTGVWVGFDDNRPLGRSETGSRAASPIWLAYMLEASKGMPYKTFVVPPNITFAAINKETGQLATASTPKENRIQGAYVEGTQPTTSESPKTSLPDDQFFLIDSHMEEVP